MRFLMVTTFFPPWNFGGDGIFVARLTRLLRRLGHHVDVVHDRDWFEHAQPGRLSDADVPAPTDLGRALGLNSRLGVLSSLLVQQLGRPVAHRRALADLLAGGDYDVVHFHNVSLMGAPALFALPAGRALKVMTAHEHWLVCPMHTLWKYGKRPCEKPDCIRCTLSYRRPPQLWRLSGAIGRGLARLDRLFVPSEYARANHASRGVSIPMSVLPHFCPEPPAGGDREDAPPYYLYVGRLESMKGVETLIEAFERVDDVELRIAGAGAEAPRLRARAARLPHVHFLGRVPPGELHALYRGARALLVPSEGPETFGMIVIEAFAHGTPVVARDFGPFPELLADDTGLLFRDTDELVGRVRALEADPDRRATLGAAGRAAWERRFSPRAHAEAYTGALASIGRDRLPAGELDALVASAEGA